MAAMKKNVAAASRARHVPAKAPADGLEREDAGPFPVVGIGASAGGLEALEQFLSHVPDGSGLAFVIVQHLDPTHKGVMPELLQRSTPMKVSQVRDRMKVRPGAVYVIPPNKDMTIVHGTLRLAEPREARGLRLPIDLFFRSLADDRQGSSIGVLLSGMGSDGTLGVRAIKEKGGLVLVQDPATAKFDSMPRSVIDAGLADLVAPADELPVKIVAWFRHSTLAARGEPGLATRDQSSLEKIVALLRTRTGRDFSPYKKQTLYRRVERRMGIHQIDKIVSYARYLQENPQELDLLSKELLIGVTEFFRDPAAWDLLRDKAIPSLLEGLASGGALRAWSAGCSTGEEAYSLAIVFKEALERLKPRGRFTLQIFATDLQRDAIDRARQGLWPVNIAADVSPERLRRFFRQEENGYRVGKEIREMVTFATQNVITDPPFTKLDILVCRNLLIYLAPESQSRLISLFHYSLNPGGCLFLGSSESVGAGARLFSPLNGKSRLYRRLGSVPRTGLEAFPAPYSRPLPGSPPEAPAGQPSANLQSLAEQVLLQQYAPPAVLVSDGGDILYVSGRTGAYLEPAAGKANWNVFAMAREGLRFELSSAFQRAARGTGPVTVSGARVDAGGRARAVDVTVQVLEKPEALRGLSLIVFSDVPTPPEKRASKRGRAGAAGGARLAELEKDFQHCRDELQSAREQMQTTLEEQKSTNEELQSANEELQSTNEELTTSREEMQSLNEELQTVNAEQQARLDEFQRVSNDMKNLLDSTEIVTVFLDGELRVRRFTSGANKIFKLIPSDVGRPLTDVTSVLAYPDMPEDARRVLRTLVFSEKPVETTDGRWFSVRIMPYRTEENVIDGLVITFGDITVAKTLEARLRAAAASDGKGGAGR
jgi:two-component system CheB/CheR fusion protein